MRFFRTLNGNEPVREWLTGLAAESRRIIGTDLARVQWRWPIGRPLVGPLGDGLYELRSRLEGGLSARVLFCVGKDGIVLLHGFLKKTQKVQKRELDIARERRRNWLLKEKG